jgi:hypothetical protein
MKATPIAVAASLLALAGCAVVRPEPVVTVAAGGAPYYCWQARLDDAGSNLVCNWDRSMTDACTAQVLVSLPKAGLTDAPRRTHRCENGQWLVAVTSR